MPKSNLLLGAVSEEIILEKIYIIRRQKVMLDRDLAEMYGAEVRVLNQAVKGMLQDSLMILCFNWHK